MDRGTAQNAALDTQKRLMLYIQSIGRCDVSVTSLELGAGEAPNRHSAQGSRPDPSAHRGIEGGKT